MKRPKLPPIFKWSYVLPRAAVVLALVATVRFGLDPALRWALVAGGEAALGAKVDVAELTTDLGAGTLTVRGITATNPSKPMRNLFEAGDVRLEVDVAQLLRKRLVVHDGLISGLMFDSERAESGALSDSPVAEDSGPSALDPVVDELTDQGLAMLDAIGGNLEEQLYDKLKTPALVDDLKTRWPKEYDALRGKVDELRSRAKQIETEVRAIKKNPLRGVERLQPMQQELASVTADLKKTTADIAALPEQAKADRAAIDVARKADVEFLRSQADVLKADPGALTQYLLGGETNDRIKQTLEWVSFARRVIPKKNAKIVRAERTRGVDVPFEATRRPACLIEQIALMGTARVGGDALRLDGRLTDLASQPELHPKPMRIELATAGAVDSTLTLVFDRRSDVAHDTLVFDCPNLVVAGRTLGKTDKLAVVVAPGEAAIHADLKLDGNQLAGVIQFSQASNLAASTPQLRDDRLAAVIAESLAGVDRVDARIELAGTLKKPQWKLESKLGEQVADGVSDAVKRYIAERKERLLAKVQGAVDGQLAEIDAKRQEAQQQLMSKLGENQDILGQVTALVGGSGLDPSAALQGAVPRLGKSLNLDKLKR